MNERVVIWDECSAGMIVFLVFLCIILIGLIFLFFTTWSPAAVFLAFLAGLFGFFCAPSRHIWTWNYDTGRVRFEKRHLLGFRSAHWEIPISSLVGVAIYDHGEDMTGIRAKLEGGETRDCYGGSSNYGDKERLVERFEKVVESVKMGQPPGGALSVADAPTGSLSPTWDEDTTPE